MWYRPHIALVNQQTQASTPEHSPLREEMAGTYVRVNTFGDDEARAEDRGRGERGEDRGRGRGEKEEETDLRRIEELLRALRGQAMTW